MGLGRSLDLSPHGGWRVRASLQEPRTCPQPERWQQDFPLPYSPCGAHPKSVFFFFFLSLFVYFEGGGGTEGKGERKSQAGSTFSTEPHAGRGLMHLEIMT